ncbi:MAG: hypothetical protein BWK75_03195 [Candidatus Altiarchaeales archaeon A3]|nr:MAG: hypothetical protein BWK75_03195 [Candidatus Altiarchaeales archaeon A3]
MKKIYKSNKNKGIAGVCGGIEEYFNPYSIIVRIGWVILILASPPAGIIGYIFAWAKIPKRHVL